MPDYMPNVQINGSRWEGCPDACPPSDTSPLGKIDEHYQRLYVFLHRQTTLDRHLRSARSLLREGDRLTMAAALGGPVPPGKS